jgi:hypothetical protein
MSQRFLSISTCGQTLRKLQDQGATFLEKLKADNKPASAVFQVFWVIFYNKNLFLLD